MILKLYQKSGEILRIFAGVLTSTERYLNNYNYAYTKFLIYI